VKKYSNPKKKEVASADTYVAFANPDSQLTASL